MIQYINKIWKNHGFEIIFVSCCVFIIIFAILRIGKKGTWSSTQIYITPTDSIKPVKKGRPKESKGEAECRRVLQSIFNKPFINCRPDFLLNPVTGGRFNLELDCYEKSLQLAVEYNGIQHYKFVPYFHKNKEAFYNQMYRDDMKRRLCKDNNISLIEVPNTVKLQDIEKYLREKLSALGFIK